jgi:hypothetical protein
MSAACGCGDIGGLILRKCIFDDMDLISSDLPSSRPAEINRDRVDRLLLLYHSQASHLSLGRNTREVAFYLKVVPPFPLKGGSRLLLPRASRR